MFILIHYWNVFIVGALCSLSGINIDHWTCKEHYDVFLLLIKGLALLKFDSISIVYIP